MYISGHSLHMLQLEEYLLGIVIAQYGMQHICYDSVNCKMQNIWLAYHISSNRSQVSNTSRVSNRSRGRFNGNGNTLPDW